MLPLVSICMPIYNSKQHIQQAIDSAINQTYSNIEIIIIDNCSDDNTWAIIKSFIDKRIVASQNETNVGMIANYKKVLAASNGKYITFLCGDDILHGECIQKQLVLLEQNKNAAFSYGLVDFIGDKSGTSQNYYKSRFLPREYCRLSLSLAQNLNFQVGTLIRKDSLPNDPISDLLYFDWLLWLELGLIYEVTSINEVVGYYRRHDQATTLKENRNLFLDDYKNMDLVLLHFSRFYLDNKLFSLARRKLLNRYIRLSLRNKSKCSDYFHYLKHFILQ